MDTEEEKGLRCEGLQGGTYVLTINKSEMGIGLKKGGEREENIFKEPVVFFIMARCNLRDKPIKLKRGRAN